MFSNAALLKSNNGSVAVESAIALALFSPALIVGLGVLYGAFAKGWVGRGAREAAVCLTTPSPPLNCRRKLENTLASGLPFGKTTILQFHGDQRGSTVRIKLEWVAGQSTELKGVVRRPVYYPRGRQ